MEPPQLHFEKLAIPDLQQSHSIIHTSIMHRISFKNPLIVMLIGLAILMLSIIFFPLGSKRSPIYVPFAILVIGMSAFLILMKQLFRSVSINHDALNECYDNYLKNPVHSDLENDIWLYHKCMAEWNELKHELRYLKDYTKYFYKENEWLEHMRQFGPTMVSSHIIHTPRGQRLKVHGFFPFYQHYELNQSLRSLHEHYLTIAEIRKFLAIKRHLIATFSCKPDAAEIKKAEKQLKAELDIQNEGLQAEMFELFKSIQKASKKRDLLYLSFRIRHAELMCCNKP